MSKPTPTQSEVRCAYSVAMYDIADDKERAEAYLLDQYEAAFDAWLAEHDAKVRAETLREAADHFAEEHSRLGGETYPHDIRGYADRIEREAGLK